MPTFVRKNIIVCFATFTAQNGSLTQPSSANLVLSFLNAAGSRQSVTLPMSYITQTNLWTAEWDSSAAATGCVDWMTYGYGTLQAADQGTFDVIANAANTV